MILHLDTYDRRLRVLGDDHPATLVSASNVASRLRSIGHYDEALRLSQDAYERHCRLHGTEHRDSLLAASGTASVLSAMGRHKEAKPGQARDVAQELRLRRARSPE